MAEIRYVRGDATAPQSEGNVVIAHICNDVGGWGKGFVLALSARWREPEAAYRRWYADSEDPEAGAFALGAVQFVPVTERITVANMIGQHGIRSYGGVPPIRYNAVEQCMQRVADHCTAAAAEVHMPRIGCGLAGGTWEEIEAILRRTLVAAGVCVTVYDFA